jgi:hypothetical protein
MHADRDNIKQYAWKGRELGDRDLFPLDRLNILDDHRGRSIFEGPLKPKENFFCTMDNVMSAKGSLGLTRFPETVPQEWLRRTSNISAELV